MVNLILAVIYLSFISLGLPDSLLGSAWPTVYGEFGVPLSFAGGVSMIIAVGTIVSSLLSDRLTRRFGSGVVTAVSVGMTAAALLGFSVSGAYWQLCLLAVPYGLGAGAVDAALNNYVALHYASRHMSWLHCMWGVGASAGPYIMGAAITGGAGWHMGYRYVAYIQLALAAMLLLSLPLWKKREAASGETRGARPLSLPQILALPGVREVLVCFFCYCALEQTAGLWASSYLVLKNGMSADEAASLAGLYFIGITVGRGISGFLTFRLSDRAMVRLGAGVMLLGAACIPLGGALTLLGLVAFGLGSAPVYPCIIHSTPALFGAERSQAIIGVQMAAAYLGTCLMPPLFGLTAQYLSAALFPLFLVIQLALMFLMYEKLLRAAKKNVTRPVSPSAASSSKTSEGL